MAMKVAFIANDFSGCRIKMWRLVERLYGKHSVDLFMANTIQKQTGLREDRCHNWSAKNIPQLAKQLRKHDVIHFFCENTASVSELLEVFKSHRIILHRHDISSLRGIADPTESSVLKHRRTRIIATSPAHVEWLARMAPKKKIVLIPNAPTLAECVEMPQEKRKPGVVYYGGLVLSPSSKDNGVGYRYYYPQWQALGEAGIPIHVYPKLTKKNEALKQLYQKIPNCVVHNSVPEEKIIKLLAQYQVSFIGYNDFGVDPKRHSYAMTCWPNKAFDPIAAGTPLLGYRTGITESLWKDKWGVATNSLDELVAGYHKAKAMQPDWQKLRQAYTLDQYIPALKALYAEVLNKN